jgi:hypothetical protein
MHDDFSPQVESAEQIIIAVRTLLLADNDGSKLSADVVKLRKQLVLAQSRFTFNQSGPPIVIDDVLVRPIEDFNRGCKEITQAFMAMQRDRWSMLDASRLPTLHDGFRFGLSSLLDFVAVAHAYEHGTSIALARYQLQTRLDYESVNETVEFSAETDAPPCISAKSLSADYDAQSGAIDKYLRSRNATIVRPGEKGGSATLFEESKARELCLVKYGKRKSKFESS